MLLRTFIACLAVCCVTAFVTPAHNSTAPDLIIKESDSPARGGSGQPNLYAAADGKLYMTWIEAINEKVNSLRFSAFDGRNWSQARTIVEGSDLMANPADFPSLVVLPGGVMVAHWPVKGEPGTHARSISIARSGDGGKSWTAPLTPHTDRSATEHGFVSMFPWSNGQVMAVWLDGRNMKQQPGGGHHAATGEVNLRYAIIGGNGSAPEDKLLDHRACECCQTSAAITADGPIVVYRDRSEKEVRDIAAVRFSRGKWSEPSIVCADGWEIPGCPVNGPAVAADGKRVAVAWFTAANNKPRVKVAFSNNAGGSFGQAFQVDDSNPAGRVDVVMLPDGSALVSWIERAEKGAEVRVRRVRPDASSDKSVVLAESNALRATGFPRMERLGNEVIFAWTQPSDSPRVRTARIRVND